MDERIAGWAETYIKDGYVGGVPIIAEAEAMEHRNTLEWAERETGASLHYKSKIHTLLTSPYTLATHPVMLDLVEALIGPDILLYNVTYIIKEPGSASHVSWHQDLTFWGLSHDDQVSAWLALSPADELSGCMRMLPGSHLHGMVGHETTQDDSNVLLQGQTVHGIDESRSRLCPLRPGEASFHHGWTLHASMPNRSEDRRIGLNIQYLAPHIRQTKHDLDAAILVRGEDRYAHFGADVPASRDLDPASIQRQVELERLYRQTAGTA